MSAVQPEVVVDADLCQGARQCSVVAPGAFEHADDGTARGAEVASVPLDRLLEAAQLCPNLAITVRVESETLFEGG